MAVGLAHFLPNVLLEIPIEFKKKPKIELTFPESETAAKHSRNLLSNVQK